MINPKLTIIIPAYNEINTIQNLVDKVSQIDVDKQIILVDDCSNDGTNEVINKNENKIDKNYLKIFSIIGMLIASLKAFYLTYFVIFIPLIIFVYKKTKSVKIFFNETLFYCCLLLSFVLLTNIFNTGCFLFPEKKTCFPNLQWFIGLETVEYLSLHYENWAKAGSGAGYSMTQSEKLNYISNFNWIDNWVEKYFFNKVSDLIYSLIFILMIFLATFRGPKITKNFNRNYKTLFLILLAIFFMWFSFHPSLRYGGYHLFFFLFFIPLSIFLEKFYKNHKNLGKKIIILVVVTSLIFIGRNISRLNKENKIYSYNILKNINYPVDKNLSFRYQTEMKNKIKKQQVKKIFNKYMFK